MSSKCLYVDDEENSYDELLSSDEYGLEFSSPFPTNEIDALVNNIIDFQPELLALDYRLDEHQKNHKNKNYYKAGGVAQLIRERAVEQPGKDFPIVLVSNERKIKDLYKPDRTAHDLFDDYYSKEMLANDLPRIQLELKSLIEGYRSIVACSRVATDCARLLGIDDEEWREFGAGDFQSEFENVISSPPHVIARHFLQNLIKRTGILLTPLDVFARLAIHHEDAAAERIWTHLNKEGLQYEGVFSSGYPRIWRHRFENWAVTIFGKPFSSVKGSERSQKIGQLLGVDIKPVHSKWTGSDKEYFAFPCASCSHPTEQFNSVAVYDRAFPSYTDRRRVCFDCLRKDLDREYGLKIQSGDAALAEQVRTGKIGADK